MGKLGSKKPAGRTLKVRTYEGLMSLYEEFTDYLKNQEKILEIR